MNTFCKLIRDPYSICYYMIYSGGCTILSLEDQQKIYNEIERRIPNFHNCINQDGNVFNEIDYRYSLRIVLCDEGKSFDLCEVMNDWNNGKIQ